MKLNPLICMQLFDAALSRGFTSLDSYLILKEDEGIMHKAYDIMESSNNYSTQQLEYVSTMLMVKTIHENMMASGELLSPYDENHKKRFTLVSIEAEADDPLLKGHTMHFSEHGFIQPAGEASLPPDFQAIISTLLEGDHLIRYLNVSFSLKYSNDMFVPVLLKGNEISPGS